MARTPLSICHVLWSIEVGGAERVVLDLAKAQRDAGHHVAVLTLSRPDGALAPEFRRVVDTLKAVPKRKSGVDPVLPIRLARWFRDHGTQVVHTHNELPLIYGAPGGKLACLPVVHSKHGVVPVSRGAHWLRQVAGWAVDRFVAVSQATAEAAMASGECSRRALRVVNNGTDLSRFPARDGARAAIRRGLGIPATARAVITVGRLVKEKNHKLLVRAIAPLLREDRHLILVGDGPLRDELRSQIDALDGPRCVHMTGARRDVPELLASADGFVLSSDSEGLPIGLLEALAAGLPVVSTAVGGIPATILPEETGLLVPPGDEAALTGALRRVFDGDPALLPMAARGRVHVMATYSAARMATAYFSLYEECLRT